MSEEWKQIEDYPAYQVSNLGRVRSMKRTLPKILKLQTDPRGYQYAYLYRKDKFGTVAVHRLVWQAFGDGRKPDNIMLVLDHKNGNPLDNSIANLNLLTHRQNSAKGWKGKKVKDLPTGVNQEGKKFIARISIDYKKVYLGRFDTPEEASEAYQNKVEEIKNV